MKVITVTTSALVSCICAVIGYSLVAVAQPTLESKAGEVVGQATCSLTVYSAGPQCAGCVRMKDRFPKNPDPTACPMVRHVERVKGSPERDLNPCTPPGHYPGVSLNGGPVRCDGLSAGLTPESVVREIQRKCGCVPPEPLGISLPSTPAVTMPSTPPQPCTCKANCPDFEAEGVTKTCKKAELKNDKCHCTYETRKAETAPLPASPDPSTVAGNPTPSTESPVESLPGEEQPDSTPDAYSPG